MYINYHGITINPATNEYSIVIGIRDCSKCTDCQRSNYCRVCIDYHYQLYKVEWSNEDKDIDGLTKVLTVINTRFQWIPFERFTNVEYLTKGGFG